MNNHMKTCAYTKGEIYTKLCGEAESGAYTSYIRGMRCKTEKDFFCEISASFQFPYYFGENWAAMDECLCDLEWLCAERIFVVIDDFSLIFSGQQEIQNHLKNMLVKYFCVMIEYWKSQNIPVDIWLNN